MAGFLGAPAGIGTPNPMQALMAAIQARRGMTPQAMPGGGTGELGQQPDLMALIQHLQSMGLIPNLGGGVGQQSNPYNNVIAGQVTSPSATGGGAGPSMGAQPIMFPSGLAQGAQPIMFPAQQAQPIGSNATQPSTSPSSPSSAFPSWTNLPMMGMSGGSGLVLG